MSMPVEEDAVAGGAVELQLDPETQFLYSKQVTGHEWELFKENVRPLKRGRNVTLLNEALKSQDDHHLKKSLFNQRRKLFQAIDEYQGVDPLLPWLQCIKWVQESFPPGGDCSGLIVIYEQCVRKFWHDQQYKDDLRYLKVWLEYAENCADAEIIFSFLEGNEIGQSHSCFYISYALLMESKNKTRTANDIFSRGIAKNAEPKEKLEAAYKKFIARSMRRPKTSEEDKTENSLPGRSFGTVLGDENRKLTARDLDVKRKKWKPIGNVIGTTTFAVYKDSDAKTALLHQSDTSRTVLNPWRSLGAQAQRNKENNTIPSKWTSHKIPQRSVSRAGTVTGSTSIEIFVDDDLPSGVRNTGDEGEKSSRLQLRDGDGVDLKKETEILREHPLRNFPQSSLPR